MFKFIALNYTVIRALGNQFNFFPNSRFNFFSNLFFFPLFLDKLSYGSVAKMSLVLPP